MKKCKCELLTPDLNLVVAVTEEKTSEHKMNMIRENIVRRGNINCICKCVVGKIKTDEELLKGKEVCGVIPYVNVPICLAKKGGTHLSDSYFAPSQKQSNELHENAGAWFYKESDVLEAIQKARESEREKTPLLEKELYQKIRTETAKEIFEELDEILNFCCDEQDIEDGCACLVCMRFPDLREKYLGKKETKRKPCPECGSSLEHGTDCLSLNKKETEKRWKDEQ